MKKPLDALVKSKRIKSILIDKEKFYLLEVIQNIGGF